MPRKQYNSLCNHHWLALVLISIVGLFHGCGDDESVSSQDISEFDGEDLDGDGLEGDGEDTTGDSQDGVLPDCEPLVPIGDNKLRAVFNLSQGTTGALISMYNRDDQVEVSKITGPAEASIPTDRVTKLLDAQYLLSSDVISILLTEGEIGDLQGEWAVDIHRATVDDPSSACFTVFRHQPSNGNVERVLRLKVIVVAKGQELKPTLSTDPDLQRVIGRAGADFGAFGVTIRPTEWTRAASEVRDQYSIVSSEAEYDALLRSLSLPLTQQQARTVRVVLIDGFDGEFTTNGGTIVGRTGAIPGTSGLVASDASAIVMSIDGINELATAQYMGDVLAHELGHMLGLTHTTETSGGTHDTLEDTAECDGRISSDYSSCPDVDNLMFPYVRYYSEGLVSDEQTSIIRSSPWVIE